MYQCISPLFRFYNSPPIVSEYYLCLCFPLPTGSRAASKSLNESGLFLCLFWGSLQQSHVMSTPFLRVKPSVSQAQFLPKQVFLLVVSLYQFLLPFHPTTTLAGHHLVNCMFSSLISLSGSQSFLTLLSNESQSVFRDPLAQEKTDYAELSSDSRHLNSQPSNRQQGTSY